MQVCTALQTDNHTNTPSLSFLQAGCPSSRPTNSVKALKALKEAELTVGKRRNTTNQTKDKCIGLHHSTHVNKNTLKHAYQPSNHTHQMGQKTGRVLVYNAAHTVANNKHKLGLFSGAINFCKNLVINQ